jgi:hypothetical protein
MDDFPTAEAEVLVRFGPSPVIFIEKVILSPTFILSAIVGCFAFWPAFRVQLYDWCHRWPSAQEWLLWLYREQRGSVVGWVAVGLAGAVLLRVFIMFVTTKYTANSDYLFVRGGLLDRANPLGPWVLYEDTHPLAQIYDCDVSQSIIQILIGSGDLYVKSVDGNRSKRGQNILPMRWIRHPKRVRDAILQHSSATKARLLGTF